MPQLVLCAATLGTKIEVEDGIKIEGGALFLELKGGTPQKGVPAPRGTKIPDLLTGCLDTALRVP